MESKKTDPNLSLSFTAINMKEMNGKQILSAKKKTEGEVLNNIKPTTATHKSRIRQIQTPILEDPPYVDQTPEHTSVLTNKYRVETLNTQMQVKDIY